MKHLETIKNNFGTPVFIYDESILCQKAEETLSFPHAYGLTVRYAMKANPNACFLRIFDSLGLHFDISSGYEADRALHAGIAPEKLSITAQELPENFEAFMNAGVKFNATSLHQLETFGNLFQGKKLGIRINPGLGSGSTTQTNVGGPSSSFGLWHEYIDQALESCRKFDLEIERIHTHIGSGNDPEVWKKVALMSLEIMKRFPEAHTLNLGGGFMVARMPNEVDTNLQDIGQHVKEAIINFKRETGRKLHLEIEPGMYLLALSGSLLCQVQDIVDTGEKGYTFLRLNTGMTDILRPSLYGAQHPVSVCGRKGYPHRSYILVGHCCESGDLLTPAPNDPSLLLPRKLPEVEIGDLLLIGAVGAYCSAMSAKNYNSFPEAAEVLLRKNGEPTTIKKRQSLNQLIQNEISPDP